MMKNEVSEMPYDEKFEIIEEAKRKYDALMGVLQEASPADPYAALPGELAGVVSAYERLPAVGNSMRFNEALVRYWGSIPVPLARKGVLKDIALSGFRSDGTWGRAYELRTELRSGEQYGT